MLLKQRLHFLQSVYTSLARRQRLTITKSVWLSDWYCGKRVKSTNCCAKDGFLSNSRMVDPPNAARVFANLVMSGQINSALRYLSENDVGVLPLIEDVMAQLREKHPNPQEARLGPLLFRASGRCPSLNLPTDKWGNCTVCDSANKRFWGSLRR